MNRSSKELTYQYVSYCHSNLAKDKHDEDEHSSEFVACSKEHRTSDCNEYFIGIHAGYEEGYEEKIVKVGEVIEHSVWIVATEHNEYID